MGFQTCKGGCEPLGTTIICSPGISSSKERMSVDQHQQNIQRLGDGNPAMIKGIQRDMGRMPTQGGAQIDENGQGYSLFNHHKPILFWDNFWTTPS